MLEVTVEDFAESFGTTADDVREKCDVLVDALDFTYDVFDGKDRDNLILEILKKIETDQQVVGAQERQAVWEEGWAENLHDLIKCDGDIQAIEPRFIRGGQPIRLNQDYIMPNNPKFEHDYFCVFRRWLFQTYLERYDAIYDIGCGSGFNLVTLAELFPDKTLHGLDFVTSSCDLVDRLASKHNWNMTGRLFDMISPDEDLDIETNSAIFTSGSIEQLSSRFEAFLQFLLKRSPAICVHVEPTIELYDEDNLVDYLAVMFHRKRGYTQGFLPRLQQLEEEAKVELLKVKRLFFGSLFMEGFSCIVWKPSNM